MTPLAAAVQVDDTTQPAAPAVTVEGIPDEMKRERRWVGWRFEHVTGRKKRWTKVPVTAADPMRRASSTDASTWTAFEAAFAAYFRGAVDGVGFVLGDGWFGFDQDGTLDLSHLHLLNTYTELSPSGKGAHAIARGRKPGTRSRVGAFELYDSDRYFTVTGHHVKGFPTTVEERTAEIASLYNRLFSSDADTTASASAVDFIDGPDDDALLARAMSAKNGEKFRKLWSGDTSDYPSHSEADAALCCMLAFWTNKNSAQMDRLFRRSGLKRDKWDEQRGDSSWGARQIADAIANTRNTYTPSSTAHVVVVDAVEGEPEPPQVVAYSFEPAFPADHFVTDWIGRFSKQCDAAHEYHEAAALVALAQATPTLKARISGSAHGLRTNLYVLFVGDPGRSRKSTSKDYCVEVVNAALPGLTLPEQMSHEGMIEALAERSYGPALWAVDEFTDMLAKMLHAKFLAGVRGMLLELYSKTDYLYKRVSKRPKKGEEPVEDALAVVGVNLSVIGCATPTLFQNLDNTAVGSGLLSRFAVVMPDSKPPRLPQYELQDDPIPSALVKRLHDIAEATKCMSVCFAPGVLQRLDEAIDAPLDVTTGRGLMTERIGVMARKVAMLAAAGRQPEFRLGPAGELLVTVDDAEAAIKVAKRWAAYAQVFESRVSEKAFEVDVERCLAVVKGRGWVHRREVARRVHVEAKVIRAIEETLVMRGQIETRVVKPATGRASEQWRWIG